MFDYYSEFKKKQENAGKSVRFVYAILKNNVSSRRYLLILLKRGGRKRGRIARSEKQSLSILVISNIEKRPINVTVRVFIAASLSTTVFHLRVHPVFQVARNEGTDLSCNFDNRAETDASALA